MAYLRWFCFATILGLICATFGAEARAGFVTYTASVPLQKTDFSALLSGSIKQFNSTPEQTLLSVTVSFTDSATITGSFTNMSSENQAITADYKVNYALSLGTDPALTLPVDTHSLTNSYSVNAGTGLNIQPVPLSGSTSMTIINPTALAYFEGTSSLDLSLIAASSVNLPGHGGNLFTSFTTVADATVTVTYNFFSPNIVPEPASVVMTGLGGLLVAAVGYAGRRRAGARGIEAR
jgi:hypothetical protein